MKKKIFLVASLILGLLATSCGKGGANTDSANLGTASDSLNYYIGAFFGTMVKQQSKMGPDSAKFNNDDFLKGLKYVLDLDTAKVGQTIGMQVGMQIMGTVQGLAQQGVNLDKKAIYEAIEKASKADSALVDPQMAQMTIQALISKAQQQAAENKPEAKANKEAGEKYITDLMKKDSSVKRTASGLAYKVVKEGNGQKFSVADEIDVIYTGSHIDGTTFDDSKGEARKFSPAAVVPGFKEALLLMSPGAEYEVYIPGKLGYGAMGQEFAGIKPNELLIFKVKTVGLSKKAETPAPATAPTPAKKK